jgi:hypothetical protein
VDDVVVVVIDNGLNAQGLDGRCPARGVSAGAASFFRQ